LFKIHVQMNLKLSISAFIGFLFLISMNLNAQKPQKKVILDGKEFYVHEVKRNETLFAISKQYNIDIQDIVVWNPFAAQGLKKGMEIKIPVISGLNQEENFVQTPDEFVYHIAEKNQTLFTIANLYKVEEKDIMLYNPEVKFGIKTGQTIKIPLNIQKILPGIIYHKIGTQETLFYLAQKYQVATETIVLFNPEINQDGFVEGKTLKIPDVMFPEYNRLKISVVANEISLSDSIEILRRNTAPCAPFKYDKITDTLRIALMLPLYLKFNKLDSFSNKITYFKDAKRFLDLYKGFMASVALLQKDMNIKVFVYDTENSASTMSQILGRTELRSVDLIIGPVYSKNIEMAAKFAALHNINIVSLVSKNSAQLINQEKVFQINPSDAARVEQTSVFLSNFYDSSIVVLHTGSLKENDFIEMYRQKITEAFKTCSALNHLVFKDVNYKLLGTDAIEDALSMGMKNMVLIPSAKEADVMEMLTKLEYLANFYDITVLGMPEWELFDNLELDLYTKLKTHYPTSTYIDYQKQKVKDFIELYRINFVSEPNIYSFLGYDVAYFFMNALKNHGREFQNCLMEKDVENYKHGLMSDFDFRRTCEKCGYENFGIFILEYQKDFSLKLKN